MNEKPLRLEVDSLIIMANDTSAPSVYHCVVCSLDYDSSDFRPI